jgi:hypothetical protein
MGFGNGVHHLKVAQCPTKIKKKTQKKTQGKHTGLTHNVIASLRRRRGNPVFPVEAFLDCFAALAMTKILGKSKPIMVVSLVGLGAMLASFTPGVLQDLFGMGRRD